MQEQSGILIPQNSPRIDNPTLAEALKLAQAGVPVFPVSQDRKPLVKWKEAATDDMAQVRRWWGRWPDAMPAMPTGAMSGISVLDVDMKNGKDGFAALRSLGLDPDTLTRVRVQTPSGGGHIYFRRRKGLTNSASRLAPGLDVRGEGGSVHALGAVNGKGAFEVLDTHIADDVPGLPDWPDVLKPVRRTEEPVTPKAPDASDQDRAWARRELEDVCAALADAEPGGRNHALNEAGFRLGAWKPWGFWTATKSGSDSWRLARPMGFCPKTARRPVRRRSRAGGRADARSRAIPRTRTWTWTDGSTIGTPPTTWTRTSPEALAWTIRRPRRRGSSPSGRPTIARRKPRAAMS